MRDTCTHKARWRWVVDEDASSLRPRWQALTRRAGPSALAGPAWTACFLAAFAPDRRIHVHALYEDDELVAVLPLQLKRAFLRRWTAPTHAHQPVWTCALDFTRPGVADEVVTHLLASAEAIDLAFLSSDDALWKVLPEAARAQPVHVALEERHSEAIIDLCAPWATFCSKVPENLTRHMQKLRQLERLGAVVFEEVVSGASLDEALAECFAVEASSWKGDRGSAMESHLDTRQFYTALVRAAADDGSLALYTLRLDGALIAFELCLKSGSRIDVLKISFAPAMAKYSPGNVLRTLALRKEVEDGTLRIRHLGWGSEWKQRWCTRTKPLYRLTIYRHGLRSSLMYGVGPQIRAWSRRSTGVRAAARSARAAAASATALAERMTPLIRRAAGRLRVLGSSMSSESGERQW